MFHHVPRYRPVVCYDGPNDFQVDHSGALPKYENEKFGRNCETPVVLTCPKPSRTVIAVTGAHLMAVPAGLVFHACTKSPLDKWWVILLTLLGFFLSGAVGFGIFSLWMLGIGICIARIFKWTGYEM